MTSYVKNIFTVYTTTKVVGVRNPFVAVVYLMLIILVWCSFLLSLHLDIRKIYQKTCPVHGVVLTKVKGFVSTEHLNDQELDVSNPNFYKRTWDAADLVYPAQGGEGETGSFAIVTNLVITSNQTLGTCSDEPAIPFSKCESDSECQSGFWSPATNGIHTGRCIKKDGSCEIMGWCPIERGRLPMKGKKALLEGVQDFTIMLKNTVEFPGCSDPQVRNLPNYITGYYLKRCRYNRVSDPLCPVFRIGDIVKWSGDNFTKVAVKGGVFRIKVKWECDLDFGKTVQDCRPVYQFLRVDDREAGVFNGWNFRSAYYYAENRRTLRKQFALKILIDLEGEGRQFDFFTLIIKFGACIGLFSIAPLVCNFLLGLRNTIGKVKSAASKLPLEDDTKFRPEEEIPSNVVVHQEEADKKEEHGEWRGNKAYQPGHYFVGDTNYAYI